MAWLSGWKYRETLTINATDVDSDVTDFHYLVYLDSSNFNFGEAQSNGYDIRFTSSDGTTLLNYIREKHDATNQVAIYHVKIPLVSSSSDTIIYMYYGNSAASDGSTAYADVFNNQVAYYPLDGNANDLSGNYNGTWSGTEQYESGVLGQAAKFDGSSFINTTLDASTISDISVVAYINGQGSSGKLVGADIGGSGGRCFQFTADNNGALEYIYFLSDTNYPIVNGNTNVLDNTWHFIGVTHNTSNIYLYTDNNIDGSATSQGNYQKDSRIVQIGGFTNVYYVGLIGRVRIYSTALSSTQISLLYKMESKTLFTFGAEENLIQTVSGTLYDKNGNAMSVACPVFAIDKDAGDLLGSTTSNTDGTFTIDVTAESGTKVLFVTEYEGTYNGDTDIAGAWLDTVQ